MIKSALFFAAAALVMGVFAPSLFLEVGSGVVGRATPTPGVAAPVAVRPSDAGAGGVSSFREASIAADAVGQYHADAVIEGAPVEMMVDTGATLVAITADTARRLGVVADPAQPKWRMNTANGVTEAEPVTLRRVSIGSIDIDDVQAVVMPQGASNANLLGESFLRRLTSVEQREGVLLLKQ